MRGSFRDPSGFVYLADGVLYRQVNRVFAEEFDACVASGLYDELAARWAPDPAPSRGHRAASSPDAHAVIEPARIEFVSYPYEWTFGELKDAALLTLDVQERALARGFVLRDASAYNVQFRGARPILIDTLSFARYREGEPWAAYKQFCEHFLVPLALMSMRDVRCGRLQREYIDGIPLDLGARCFPVDLGARRHAVAHAHARAGDQAIPGGIRRGRDAEPGAEQARTARVRGQPAQRGGAAQLAAGGHAVGGLRQDHNYSEGARAAKHVWCAATSTGRPQDVWDLGGNTGTSAGRRGSAAVVCGVRLRPRGGE